MRLTPEQAVQVRVLVGAIALCSWAKHFLVVPLSTQVYKMGTTKFNSGGNPAMN